MLTLSHSIPPMALRGRCDYPHVRDARKGLEILNNLRSDWHQNCLIEDTKINTKLGHLKDSRIYYRYLYFRSASLEEELGTRIPVQVIHPGRIPQGLWWGVREAGLGRAGNQSECDLRWMLLEWLHPILQGSPEMLAPPCSHPTRSTATFVSQDRHLRTKATDLATEGTSYQTHWHAQTTRRELKNQVRAPTVSAPPTQQHSWLSQLQSLESHLQQESEWVLPQFGLQTDCVYPGGVERLFKPVLWFTETGLWFRSPAFSGFHGGNEYVVKEAAWCGQGLLALPKKRNPSLHMSHSLALWHSKSLNYVSLSSLREKRKKMTHPRVARIVKWDNA